MERKRSLSCPDLRINFLQLSSDPTDVIRYLHLNPNQHIQIQTFFVAILPASNFQNKNTGPLSLILISMPPSSARSSRPFLYYLRLPLLPLLSLSSIVPPAMLSDWTHLGLPEGRETVEASYQLSECIGLDNDLSSSVSTGLKTYSLVTVDQ